MKKNESEGNIFEINTLKQVQLYFQGNQQEKGSDEIQTSKNSEKKLSKIESLSFREVAQIFEQLESESSRLKITEVLASLFKQASPKDAQIISYLSLGNLYPPYIGSLFNFADKTILKLIAQLIDKTQDEVKNLFKVAGDYGTILQQNFQQKQKLDTELTLQEVFDQLDDFLKISGKKSQELKNNLLLNLLQNLDPLSGKFIIRIILGKLRLGFSDMTLLDAYSWMMNGDKSLRKDLEEAYNIQVDTGTIIKTLKEQGIEGIKNIKIEPGIPIKPAAADRLPNTEEILKKLGPCVAQPKLDGFRLQVHINRLENKEDVYFFSRNLIDMSGSFPDLKKAVLDELKNIQNLVVEGEAIAYDVETGVFLPFQETIKRKRKYDVTKMSEEVPLKLYFFDLLYLNGESYLNYSHEDRRKTLVSLFNNYNSQTHKSMVLPIEEKQINDAPALQQYFDLIISQGSEGLVVKRPSAVYQSGKRNSNWIKLKRTEQGSLKDTVDCVVLGYYYGHGKRSDFGIGAILVGIYNSEEDKFQTIAKIGTGLSDEEWINQKKICDEYKMDHQPSNIQCAKELFPDVWVKPQMVCLIDADEITRSPLHTAGHQSNFISSDNKKQIGFALRFPRIIGQRPDKSPMQATTTGEIENLFDLQFQNKDIKNNDIKEDNES